MTTQWSGMDKAGNNGMKIGLDASVSAVTSSSTTCTITFPGWTGNLYNYADNGQTFVWSGAITGTDTYNNTQGSGTTTLRATRSVVYTYPANSYGTSPGTITVTVRVGYSYNGSHPQITRTVAIPARPYAAPNSPGTVRSSRVSDTQMSVAIAAGSITAARPVTSTTVQRKQWNGNTGWSTPVTVATLPGAPTSWTDTGTQVNQLYSYQVRYNNSAGSSGWVEGNTSSTTPSVPAHVAAALSGTQITVSWGNNVNYYPWDSHFVERSTNGGAWIQVAADLSWAATSWIDTAPAGGSNQYRVRSRSVDGGAGNPAIFGPYGTSNVVSTIIPPLAPTLLVPNGAPADAAKLIALSWQHNPGGDSAAQTSFEVQWSVDAGSTWSGSGKVTSGISQWTLLAGTLLNGQTYLWRVRTWGADPSASPWSASATLTTASTPVVTLTSPDPTITALPVVTAWSFAQDQGQSQAAWQAELSDGTSVLQVGSGATEVSWPVTVPLIDGATYTVRVRARATSGLWSDWQTISFTIDLLPPADVTLTPTFDPGSGVMVLALHAADAEPGVSNPVDTVQVQRRTDDGDWATITQPIRFTDGSDTVVLDTTPSLAATISYRLVVTSIAPSTLVTDPVEVVTSGTCWCFLSYGPGFATILRAGVNVAVSGQAETASALQPASGREWPILLLGDQRGQSRQVSMLADWGYGDSSTGAEWLAAGLQKGIVCFRDHVGVRIFGRLSGMQVTPGDWPYTTAQVSFTVEQVDYREGF